VPAAHVRAWAWRSTAHVRAWAWQRMFGRGPGGAQRMFGRGPGSACSGVGLAEHSACSGVGLAAHVRAWAWRSTAHVRAWAWWGSTRVRTAGRGQLAPGTVAVASCGGRASTGGGPRTSEVSLVPFSELPAKILQLLSDTSLNVFPHRLLQRGNGTSRAAATHWGVCDQLGRRVEEAGARAPGWPRRCCSPHRQYPRPLS